MACCKVGDWKKGSGERLSGVALVSVNEVMFHILLVRNCSSRETRIHWRGGDISVCELCTLLADDLFYRAKKCVWILPLILWHEELFHWLFSFSPLRAQHALQEISFKVQNIFSFELSICSCKFLAAC